MEKALVNTSGFGTTAVAATAGKPTPEMPPIGVPELAPLKNGNCVTRSIYVFNDDNTDIQTDVASVKTDVASVKTDVASVKTSISNLPVRAGTGNKST